MTPIGWLAYYHDGLGGFIVHSSQTQTWESLPATGILAVREIYDFIHKQTPLLLVSCVFKGEWIWREKDSKGVWRFKRTWIVNRPAGIPDNLIAQGVELADDDWKKLYPTVTHADVLVADWT